MLSARVRVFGLPAVGGAADGEAATVQDVSVDHGRRHVLVPQQLLNGPDVVPVLEKMGGEGMTESMAASFAVPSLRSSRV
jgi:hypothetical protein